MNDTSLRTREEASQKAKKYEAVKQPRIFCRKGEPSVVGAEGGTCLTGSAERGHRGAVRERAAHGNDGVVCAGSKSRIGREKSPSKSARAFGAEGGTCKERSDGIANAERGRLDIISQGA